MTTNADIFAQLRRDVEAVKAECAPCRSVANKGICLVRPCGPHCAFSYTDERPPACGTCQSRDEARARIAGLDGPKLLEALLEEHEAIAAIGGDCDGAGECMVCAVIADCADALEVSI